MKALWLHLVGWLWMVLVVAIHALYRIWDEFAETLLLERSSLGGAKRVLAMRGVGRTNDRMSEIERGLNKESTRTGDFSDWCSACNVNGSKGIRVMSDVE